jgi:hypothetical protein
VSHRHPRRSSRVSRWTIAITTLFMLGSLLPLSAATALAAPPAAGAVASGFLFYKHQTPQPACTALGLNVSEGPFYTPEDCGFAVFGVAGAPTTANVQAALQGPDGATFATVNAPYDAVDANWSFPITPGASWPAGWITVVISVDGEEAGRTTFGHKLLGAEVTVDPAGAPYAPGDDLPATIQIGQMDNTTDAVGATRTGVAARFSLVVITPGGDVRPVPGGAITANASGTATATIPGELTADLQGNPDAGFEVVAAVAAVDASYTDPSAGAWAAAEATAH